MKNKFYKFLMILFSPFGWIIYLISYLSVRDKNIIVFGTHVNVLSGNIRALLLDKEIKSDFQKVFITHNHTLFTQAEALGVNVYRKYSLKGMWYTLRAGSYIYSSYPSDINFWLSGGVKYINVWHGTPIKKIEYDITTGYYGLRNDYSWIYRLITPSIFVKPNVLLVASEYEKKCFATAFKMKNENNFVKAYPPHLRFIKRDSSEMGKDTTVLYMPTWRDDHSFSFQENIDLDRFNQFLNQNSIKFYIKLHPSDLSKVPLENYSNIFYLDQDSDIYDYLLNTDILVSDYSSIVFDCLYLQIPVVLYCPDYEVYQKQSRQFYIDPCYQLPVQIAYTQKELEERLLSKLDNEKSEFKVDKDFSPYEKDGRLLENLLKKAGISV